MPVGAKKKLTPEMIKELCALKSSGLKNISVCNGVGISDSILYEWMRNGTADIEANKDSIYSQFFVAYKKAETTHKLKRLKQIQDAAEIGQWQAAAWELERCYPKEYGKRVVNEMVGKNDGAIQARIDGELSIKDINLNNLTDDGLEKLGKLLGCNNE